MAKWIEYLLKKKPADEDMLMLEDAETHNNKRVSFSGIADWLIEKMKKNNLISGALRFKGSSAYAALPGKGAAENDYYYCTDGDGTHGPGYYAWNGSSWIWIGNNDKGIDKSLKVEGAAAEAAATGEAVASLNEAVSDLDSFVGIIFENGYITSNGVEVTGSGYKKTNFIPCFEGIIVTFIADTANPYVNCISFYDENKNYISGFSNIGSDDKLEYSVTAPENTRFTKISTTDYLLTNNLWKIKFSESPITLKICDDVEKFSSIEYKKIDKKFGKNLFNKNSDRIVTGNFLNGNGDMVVSEAYAISDFIPVEPNTKYTITNSARGGAHDVWYAKDMKTVVGDEVSGYTYTSPADSAFFKISFVIKNIDIIQVEKGETFTGYEAYTDNINSDKALVNSSEALEFAKKHEEIFDDNRDIKNYLVWCDETYIGKKYDNTGTLISDSAFTSTDIIKLDRTKNLYCGVSYTSYANFYDKDKKHIEQKTFYYGKDILAADFPQNAERVSFSLYTKSGLLADEPYVSTKFYNNGFEGKRFRSTIKKTKGMRPVINVYKTDSESVIIEKMYNAFLTEDCDVYFENGTYIFSELYDKFIEWNQNDAKELIIGGNCRYFFNGSTLIANWGSENADYMSNASLLGSRRLVSSYELHDAKLVCNGMTYCVHDEASGMPEDYCRKYHNIEFIYNNGIGTTYLSKCLGGGSGLNGVCVFENCIFESNADLDNPQELSYHGASNDGEGFFSLVISNCYFKHEIGLHGLGTNQKAKCLFNGNSCASLPEYDSSSDKWNVLAFNNVIRSD